MSKTVLVTGATGFIGSAICNWLYNNDHQVIAVGTKGENQPLCHKFLALGLDGIPWSQVPNIDICCHQAANNDTMDMDKENMFRCNFTSPSKLFDRLFKERGCKQFVYASSASVYGKQPVPHVEKKTKLNPLTPYAQSKVFFEQFAEPFALENNVNVVGLRYSNVYGPGEDHKGKRASMVHQLLRKMQAGERPKIFRNGHQLRDWVYIKDVVKANILANEYKHSGIFNVGAGESMSFNNVVATLNDGLGTAFSPEYIDCPFGDLYQENTLLDLTHAGQKLGYQPEFNIRNGILQFVEEMKKATK